jgi:hypothetical protein
MDRLMLEEGDMDEECADEDKIRDQVGKLHHRAILDEDQREVRLFQEAFLEDGELHSDNARTRKFRWKDADEDIGDLERRPSDDDAEDPTGNTQQDEKWRLERLEREKWVKESELAKSSKIKTQGGSEDDINNDEDSDNEDSQFFSMATKALKKLHKKKSDSSSSINGVKSSSVGGDSLVAMANDIKEQDSATRKDFKSPKGKLPLQIVSNNSSNVRASDADFVISANLSRVEEHLDRKEPRTLLELLETICKGNLPFGDLKSFRVALSCSLISFAIATSESPPTDELFTPFIDDDESDFFLCNFFKALVAMLKN